MGGEFGQTEEWNFQQGLAWHLLDYDGHRGVQEFVKELNATYRSAPALYEKQFSPEGFQWIDYGDRENSVLVYIRKGLDVGNDLVVVCNFTPVPRKGYRIGMPKTNALELVLNSDDRRFGGSGLSLNLVTPVAKPSHGYETSFELDLPPLGIVILK